MGYKGKASLRRVCDMTTQNNVSVPQMLLPGGGGGTWVFFGWICAARDSKLAPVLKTISPKIDTPF